MSFEFPTLCLCSAYPPKSAENSKLIEFDRYVGIPEIVVEGDLPRVESGLVASLVDHNKSNYDILVSTSSEYGTRETLAYL